MALRDDLKVLGPEFTSETDDRLDQFLDWAALSINRRVFGSKADLATILLAAHYLTRFPSSGGNASQSGSITMEKVGELQQSYSDLSGKAEPSDVELMTTSYGARYVTLRRSTLATPLVV